MLFSFEDMGDEVSSHLLTDAGQHHCSLNKEGCACLFIITGGFLIMTHACTKTRGNGGIMFFLLAMTLIAIGSFGCNSDSNLTNPVEGEAIAPLAALAEQPTNVIFQRGEEASEATIETLVADNTTSVTRARAAGIVGVWKVNEKYLKPSSYKGKKTKGYYVFEGTARKGKCTVATKINGTHSWYVAAYNYKVVGQRLTMTHSYTQGTVSSKVSCRGTINAAAGTIRTGRCAQVWKNSGKSTTYVWAWSGKRWLAK